MKRRKYIEIKLPDGNSFCTYPFEPKPDTINLRLPIRIKNVFDDVSKRLDLNDSEVWRLALTIGLDFLNRSKST